MNILLLGGTGFIGRCLQRQRPTWAWTAYGSKDFDLTDSQSTDKIGGHFDIVLNCAGFYGGIVFNQKYQRQVLYRNMAITMNIGRLIDRIKPRKFISIGSACIYPITSQSIMSESLLGTSQEYHPSIYYSALSKSWLLQIMQTMDIDWEYLILSNVFGPREHLDYERSHFVGSLINKIRKSNQSIQMLGTGIAVRDFIYIDDAVESICRYCELPVATNSATNISTGRGSTIFEMTHNLVSYANPKLTIEWGSPNDNGVLYKVLDNSKMLSDIQFPVDRSIVDALHETWDWFANRHD